MSRRTTIAVLMVGVMLALLPAGWWLTRPDGTVGQDDVARLAASTPAAGPSSATSPAPSPSGSTATPRTEGSSPVAADRASASPVRPGRATGTAGARPGPDQPARLVIPALDVDARVVPVGIDPSSGEMQVPKAVDVVGWYRYGPALAEPAGSTVLAGHVDAADQGAGAFFRLRELRPGQRFTVTGGDGRVRTYRIVAREVYAKKSAPLDRVFARDGAPRLTLVTCGGSFDSSTRSYRDNIVVTAVEEAR